MLTAGLRNLDLAEESLAEAYASALRTWPRDGVPEHPDAWLLTTARRRATDVLRRESTLRRKLPLLVTEETTHGPEDIVTDLDEIPDLRLRLLLTCCHPALAMESRVALTLRCVGGLSTSEVAAAFLVSEPTMAARITRAKKKIAAARIPYRDATTEELPERLDGVLAVLYLIFNEGYAASSGAEVVRRELAAEAIRLTRVVAALAPTEHDPRALLALMLLQHSRRDARTDDAGELVLLADQDRDRWDHDAIGEGAALLTSVTRATPYALQAAIAAQHALAPLAGQTDWAAVVALYDRLLGLTGSPVVALNRAVALAEAAGPAAALPVVEQLADALTGYHLWHAVRADLLRRLGRADEARHAYRDALRLAGSAADQAFLATRIAELD